MPEVTAITTPASSPLALNDGASKPPPVPDLAPPPVAGTTRSIGITIGKFLFGYKGASGDGGANRMEALVVVTIALAFLLVVFAIVKMTLATPAGTPVASTPASIAGSAPTKP